jgi:hypothetical protein
VPILLIALLLVFYLGKILLVADGVHWSFRVIGAALMSFNLYNFLYTLLADPGIPEDLWEHYYSNKFV